MEIVLTRGNKQWVVSYRNEDGSEYRCDEYVQDDPEARKVRIQETYMPRLEAGIAEHSPDIIEHHALSLVGLAMAVRAGVPA